MLITYSQNGEDILLYRCFKNIKNGFYIDVGANDPKNESVTKLFYDLGWSGINIEPEMVSFNKLKTERPRDINLNVYVSRVKGNVDFFQVINTGLSSVNEMYISNAIKRGYKVKKTLIPSLSLNNIIENTKVGKNEINFMKVDTEGSEEDVIKSIDFTKYRPWVLLLESVTPDKYEDSSEKWENYIIQNGYKFVYFDGLNKYFISNEKYEILKKCFETPINIFDGFIGIREWETLSELNKYKLNFSQNNFYIEKTKILTDLLVETNRNINEKQERITLLEDEYNKNVEKITKYEQILSKFPIKQVIPIKTYIYKIYINYIALIKKITKKIIKIVFSVKIIKSSIKLFYKFLLKLF